MGQQDGIIKIKGQIGDLTFYKTKEGDYQARRKGGVSAQRIKDDPNYERVRENNQEFGRAGKASKLLRTAFRALLVSTADSRMNSRLTREMMKVLQADATNARGKRTVIDGETEMLTGFEFNQYAQLNSTLFAPYNATIDRATGKLQLLVPDFAPAVMIKAPNGATHFRIMIAGAEVNFEQATYTVDQKLSPVKQLTPELVVIEPLISQVPVNAEHPLFLAVGIEFYQMVNGQQYPLKNGAHNALALVKVDGGA